MDSNNFGDALDFLVFKCNGREKEAVPISSEQTIDVYRYLFTFDSWKGVSVANRYGNKPIVDYHGEPLFGELAVLRMFQEEGFDGVWVDSFSGLTFRKDMLDKPPVQIPENQFAEYNKIASRTGSSGGCWDVMVWKDGQTFFVEVKCKDKILSSQIRWLKAALELGYSDKCFISVKWKQRKEQSMIP